MLAYQEGGKENKKLRNAPCVHMVFVWSKTIVRSRLGGVSHDIVA